MRDASRPTAISILVWILVAVPACSTGSIETTGAAAGDVADAVPATTPTTLASTSEITDPAGPSTTTSTIPATTTTLTPLDEPTFESIAGINLIREFTGYSYRGLGRWLGSVPGVEDIRIESTADGSEQPALWLPPSGDSEQPLLVILHSWSSPYTQHAGIPYAMWAQENGWAVIAPDFRGRNNDPAALGSDLAVQDVVDAIDHAIGQDGVAADRVYAVGYSGGGMMALLLAGRHPDKVTAVAAWGPVYDLVDFYDWTRAIGRRYAWEISSICGGDPRESGDAQDECLRRSPMTYLDGAREEGVPVYIAQGIWDSLVRPSQGAEAFNQLAAPEDRLTAQEVDQVRQRRLPDSLVDSITTDSFFGDGDPKPVFARNSDAVWLVYFQGDHEMAYLATLRWFASDPR